MQLVSGLLMKRGSRSHPTRRAGRTLELRQALGYCLILSLIRYSGQIHPTRCPPCISTITLTLSERCWLIAMTWRGSC